MGGQGMTAGSRAKEEVCRPTGVAVENRGLGLLRVGLRSPRLPAYSRPVQADPGYPLFPFASQKQTDRFPPFSVNRIRRERTLWTTLTREKGSYRVFAGLFDA
jgi:hypothetical protein